MNTSLTEGRAFSTYDELNSVLEMRNRFLGEQWRVAPGGITVKSRNKSIKDPSYHYPERLRFYRLNLRCVNQGIWVSKRGTGQREKL